MKTVGCEKQVDRSSERARTHRIAMGKRFRGASKRQKLQY